MCLNFSHIVSNVVDLIKLPELKFTGKYVFERLASVMRQQLAIGEGVIGCAAHGSQIGLSFW